MSTEVKRGNVVENIETGRKSVVRTIGCCCHRKRWSRTGRTVTTTFRMCADPTGVDAASDQWAVVPITGGLDD